MLNHVKAPVFDSDPPQNLPVFSRVALHNEEYVRPEMLKWMALGKEEHREKEELKKLAMEGGNPGNHGGNDGRITQPGYDCYIAMV